MRSLIASNTIGNGANEFIIIQRRLRFLFCLSSLGWGGVEMCILFYSICASKKVEFPV